MAEKYIKSLSLCFYREFVKRTFIESSHDYDINNEHEKFNHFFLLHFKNIIVLQLKIHFVKISR